MCFLDELVEESESYAKGVGEWLKGRVSSSGSSPTSRRDS